MSTLYAHFLTNLMLSFWRFKKKKNNTKKANQTKKKTPNQKKPTKNNPATSIRSTREMLMNQVLYVCYYICIKFFSKSLVVAFKGSYIQVLREELRTELYQWFRYEWSCLRQGVGLDDFSMSSPTPLWLSQKHLPQVSSTGSKKESIEVKLIILQSLKLLFAKALSSSSGCGE